MILKRWYFLLLLLLPETEPSSVQVDITETQLEVGLTQSLIATVLPPNATDKTVTWTSLDGAVATVDNSGLITAKAIGTTTVTATTINNLTATCLVEVVGVIPKIAVAGEAVVGVDVTG